MGGYTLLDKQKEFMEIPHNYELDVAIYQGGYGSGKTWCGSLLGTELAKKYPGSRGLVGAKEYELVRKTTLVSYLEHLNAMKVNGWTQEKLFKTIVDFIRQKKITEFDQIIWEKDSNCLHVSYKHANNRKELLIRTKCGNVYNYERVIL